jgi:hypothetical protein
MLATRNPKLAILIFVLGSLILPVYFVGMGVQSVVWLRDRYPYAYNQAEWLILGLATLEAATLLGYLSFVSFKSVAASRHRVWLEPRRWMRYWRDVLWSLGACMLLLLVWLILLLIATFPP